MPRKSDFGKYIYSAGEIGEYVVCPEAWRLKMLRGVKSTQREDSKRGTELHQQWAEEYDESLFLSRGVKIAATLIIVAIVFFMWSNL